MPWSRKSRRAKVQIDTDWLLGPAPQPKPQRSQRPSPSIRTGVTKFLAFAGLVGLTGVVIWKWEVASQEVLRWQWSRLLSKDETTEETLAALVALSDSMEDADAMLLAQLKSEPGNRRTVAFQLLKNRIEQRAGKPIPHAQCRVAVSMLQSFDLQDRELIMMRGWLASRLLTIIPAEDPSFRTDREVLISMIGDASEADLAQQTVAPEKALEAVVSLAPEPALARAAPGPAPTPVPASRVPSRLSDAIEPARKLALPSLPPLPETPPHQPPPSWSPETKPASMVSFSRQAAKHSGSELVSPVVTGGMKYEVTPVAPNLRAVPSASTNKVAGSMRGLGKLGTDQVMRLLESTQDRLVAQAVSELEARGLKPQHLELAMELARGSSSERMAAMDKLSGDPEINPVPWLVWMAESGDREVRMRAISMLGATADDEALRKLRLLKQREIDNRVADQITQVLLAAGSARSSNR